MNGQGADFMGGSTRLGLRVEGERSSKALPRTQEHWGQSQVCREGRAHMGTAEVSVHLWPSGVGFPLTSNLRFWSRWGALPLLLASTSFFLTVRLGSSPCCGPIVTRPGGDDLKCCGSSACHPDLLPATPRLPEHPELSPTTSLSPGSPVYPKYALSTGQRGHSPFVEQRFPHSSCGTGHQPGHPSGLPTPTFPQARALCSSEGCFVNPISTTQACVCTYGMHAHSALAPGTPCWSISQGLWPPLPCSASFEQHLVHSGPSSEDISEGV